MRMLLCALLLAAQPGVSPHQKYDPARDADRDIRNAIAQAQKTDKRILLEVGGEWCTWCHILDRYAIRNWAAGSRGGKALAIGFSSSAAS